MSLGTVEFHGVPVRATTPVAATDELLNRALSGAEPTAYRLVNSYTFALANRNDDYMGVLQGPGVNLPDGGPLATVLDWTHPDVECQQVRGPGLFEDCLAAGRAHGVKHFFLGSTPETLATLVDEARAKFPGVEVVGSWSPPFRPLTAEELVEQDTGLRTSGAHVVWVGLGTPKQDVEALRIVASTGITAVAVGAAFDFTAGTKPIAPAWMRASHLEWLFRLATEPGRLWKRYLIGNTQFIALAARHVVSSMRN